jgi:SNF family Na+-dependent transporter
MNKNAPRLLWMLAFSFLGSAALFAFIAVALPWSFHDDKAGFERKATIAVLVALVCIVGLPSLALILSNRGVLPGTRCRKERL